jgi:hypothetical protein
MGERETPAIDEVTHEMREAGLEVFLSYSPEFHESTREEFVVDIWKAMAAARSRAAGFEAAADERDCC